MVIDSGLVCGGLINSSTFILLMLKYSSFSFGLLRNSNPRKLELWQIIQIIEFPVSSEEFSMVNILSKEFQKIEGGRGGGISVFRREKIKKKEQRSCQSAWRVSERSQHNLNLVGFFNRKMMVIFPVRSNSSNLFQMGWICGLLRPPL